MASSSTASFHLLSVITSSTTLSSSSKTSSICIFPSAINPFPKLFSTPTSSKLFEPSSSSRFVRNLAVASPFELDQEDLSSDGDEEQQRSPDLKVYVGNLPWNVDSAALAGLFQRAGNVDMVEVVYDKVSGRSRGFGFVTMSSIKEVEQATQQFNGYELDGRQLRVNSGPPPIKGESSFRGQRDSGDGGSDTNKVYVGNLAWSVDNVALVSRTRKCNGS